MEGTEMKKKTKKNRNQKYIDSVWCEADAILKQLENLRTEVRKQEIKQMVKKSIYLTELIRIVEQLTFVYDDLRFRILRDDKAMLRSRSDLEYCFKQKITEESCSIIPSQYSDEIKVLKVVPNRIIVLMKLN